MKIYAGKNKKKSKEISFEELLAIKLREKGFDLNTGMFSDESASWVEIKQKTSDKQITISFVFDKEEIDKVNVYEAKIMTIIDEENQKKII